MALFFRNFPVEISWHSIGKENVLRIVRRSVFKTKFIWIEVTTYHEMIKASVGETNVVMEGDAIDHPAKEKDR